MREIKAKLVGLKTGDAFASTPDGGLLVAENIVFRGKNRPEPRESLTEATNSALSGTTATAIRGIALAGTEGLLVQDSGNVYGPGGSTLSDDAGSAVEMASSLHGGEVTVRGFSYLATKGRAQKLALTTSTATLRIGAPPPCVPAVWPGTTSSVTDGWFTAALPYAAYRLVTKRRYSETGGAEPIEVRSAPSGLFYAYGANQTYPTIYAFLHEAGPYTFRAGDIIEFYRTAAAATTAAIVDETYLAGFVQLSATNITNGYVSWEDKTFESGLGAALYTNTSEEGVEAANYLPPKAKLVETFRESLFLGNLSVPKSVSLDLRPLTSRAQGSIGPFPRGESNRAMTNGAATFTTAIASSLRVGMIVVPFDSHYHGTSDGFANASTVFARITGISGTTVTVSQVWNGTTANHDLYYHHSVRIKSATKDAYYPLSCYGAAYALTSLRLPAHYIRGASSLDGESGHPDVLADISYCAPPSSTSYSPGYDGFVLEIEAINAETSVEVFATCGDQLDPVIPLTTASTGYSLAAESLPGYLWWSKRAQPEHFPPTNLDAPGDPNANIVAMHATKEALLVFKDDGLYRVTGDGADSGFRFDLVDSSVRATGPGVTVLDKAYVMTRQGIVEATPYGAKVISGDLDGLDFGTYIRDTSAPSAQFTYFARFNEVHALVNGVVYVYNLEFGAWTTALPYCDSIPLLSRYPSTDRVVYAITRSGTKYTSTMVAPSSFATYHPSDSFGNTTVTVTAVTGTAVTHNAVTPALRVGDILKGPELVPVVVTAVTDTTHCTVHTTGLTAGSKNLYRAVACRLKPHLAGKDPGALKTWGEGRIWWAFVSGRQHRIDFTSEQGSTEVAFPLPIPSAYALTPSGPLSFKFSAPRRHGRTQRLYPEINVQAATPWAIEGLDVSFEPAGSRVRRT